MSVKKVWYTGLRPPKTWNGRPVFSCPLIEIAPRPVSSPDIAHVLQRLDSYQAFLFTSQTAVELFSQLLQPLWPRVPYYAVGPETGRAIKKASGIVPNISPVHTAEGLVDFLPPVHTYCWPHAAGARRVITDALQEKVEECILYDTKSKFPPRPIPWDEIDRIVFTSPSTVQAFCEFFPKGTEVDFECIGPITQKAFSDRETLKS